MPGFGRSDYSVCDWFGVFCCRDFICIEMGGGLFFAHSGKRPV